MNSSYSSTLMNQGTAGFPRMGLQKLDPSVEAVLSKLVPANHHPGSGTQINRRPSQIVGPDMSLLERISDQTTANVVDAHSLFQLLPDTELAMQVLVSSIISPKDLVSTEINYSVEPGSVPPEVASAALEVIRDHFENNHKIGEMLPEMLRDALFLTGSYPMMVLPETTIDSAINSRSRVSTESLREIIDPSTKLPRSIGLLGNPGSTDERAAEEDVSLESLFDRIDGVRPPNAYDPKVGEITFSVEMRESPEADKLVKRSLKFDPKLTIVDNPQILRVPELISKLRTDKLNDLMRPAGLSAEAFSGTDRYQRSNAAREAGGKPDPMQEARERGSLYRTRQFQATPVLSMAKPSSLSRESVGHPLVIHLPSECVIPVHVPSSPEKHLGYFVLLDRQGNPLVKAMESDYFTEMSNNLKSNRELSSQLIANTQRATSGADWQSRQMDIDEMTRVYSDIVEAEITQRLKRGLYGEGVQVAKPQEVYRIMLARALAGMHTQMLYVPAELMTYFAFDYNQYGVGVSLLQKSKIIGGLRAMMLFADTMAGIKNSVGRTIVNIQLDEQDPDPAATAEGLMHEFAYARSSGLMPLGATAPRDIVNYMQQASVEYAISGNPRYPSTTVSVEDRPNNRTRPDDKLQEDLKRRQLMSFGLAPETVDATQSPEFATSVVANNLLLTKRVVLWQKDTTGMLQDHVARYTLNSGILMERLRDAVRQAVNQANRDSESAADLSQDQVDSYAQAHVHESDIDSLVVDFVYALRLSLPKPDQATGQLQIEAFDRYYDGLGKALACYINVDFLKEMELGSTAQDVEVAIEAIRAHFMREWMRNNNVFPELDILTQMEDDGPALDMAESNAGHVEAVRKSLGTYLKQVLAKNKQFTEDMDKLKEQAGVDTSGGYSSDYGSSETGGDDTGGDDGLGDLGGDPLGDGPDDAAKEGAETTDAPNGESEEEEEEESQDEAGTTQEEPA